jgi:hypothetical protein
MSNKDKYYIYLSSIGNIKIKVNDIKDYLLDIKSKIHNDYHIFFDDILLNKNEMELDELLNILYSFSKDNNVNISCIKKARKIKKARGKFNHKNLTNNNCIYVANLDEGDTDKIGYWELGYAEAKQIKIIGYRSGKFTNCDDNFLMSVGTDVSDNSCDFLETVSDILEGSHYYLPGTQDIESYNNWNKVGNIAGSCSNRER